MSTRTRLPRILLAAGVGAALVAGTGAAVATQADDTTTDVQDILTHQLESEQMARDLYGALGEAHDGQLPFERIEGSEQRHRDAVAHLITLKGGTVPAEVMPGDYTDPQIQATYEDWLERGLVSPEAALEVGAELETADIERLRSAVQDIDDADVDRVLGHLLSASEHHLAAFERDGTAELPAGQRGPGSGPGGGQWQDEGSRQDGAGQGEHRWMHRGQQGPGTGGPHRHGGQQGPGSADCPWLDD